MPTIRIPLKISVEVKGADGEDLQKTLERIVGSGMEIRPMEVAVLSPHGIYQEFGTKPAKKGSGTGVKGKPSPVRMKFREWARVRCADKAAAMGISTDRFGDMVYHKIMSEGMEEHPYFRPAIYEVLDSVSDYFGEGGGGTVAMANDIRDRAKENLILHKNVYTGELMESIVSREFHGDMSTEPLSELEQEVWRHNSKGQEAR